MWPEATAISFSPTCQRRTELKFLEIPSHQWFSARYAPPWRCPSVAVLAHLLHFLSSLVPGWGPLRKCTTWQPGPSYCSSATIHLQYHLPLNLGQIHTFLYLSSFVQDPSQREGPVSLSPRWHGIICNFKLRETEAPPWKVTLSRSHSKPVMYLEAHVEQPCWYKENPAFHSHHLSFLQPVLHCTLQTQNPRNIYPN